MPTFFNNYCIMPWRAINIKSDIIIVNSCNLFFYLQKMNLWRNITETERFLDHLQKILNTTNKVTDPFFVIFKLFHVSGRRIILSGVSFSNISPELHFFGKWKKLPRWSCYPHLMSAAMKTTNVYYEIH